jgi:glycosyltransferase involved in cell wall biosynthesis
LQCAGAAAAAYVTENILQQRYPPQPSAYTTHFSSVELLEDAFVERVPAFYRSESEVTIVHIGTMDQVYKGQDDLIQAVHLCLVNGLEIRLILIGDGRYCSEYKRLVTDLNLEDKIVFLGQLPGSKAVRTQLDKADLFVLPSRTEGLPRALIEAMARGLPCIGSKVGGIPELLPEDALFPANDPAMLAQKIMEVLSNPERMCEMSKHNLQVASDYKAELLRERRREFYQYVHDTTLEYMQRGA